MKPYVADSRHALIHESRIMSLIVSVGLHGVAVIVITAGTWLWGEAAFKPLPSYTVALVDAPLSLKQPAATVKPKSQAKPPPPKASAPKPDPPPKSVAKPAQVKPAPVPAKPPSKTVVKPIAKPKPAAKLKPREAKNLSTLTKAYRFFAHPTPVSLVVAEKSF